MLKLNFEALGVTEDALAQSILDELGMTKEQAVTALAQKFGVDVSTSAIVQNGERVRTTQGEAIATVLTPSEINTLREAASIQTRLFS